MGLTWADAYITRIIVSNDFGWEGNPFLKSAVHSDDFLILKIVGTFFALVILRNVYRKRPKAATHCILTFIFLYTSIVWWNVSIVCRFAFS